MGRSQSDSPDFARLDSKGDQRVSSHNHTSRGSHVHGLPTLLATVPVIQSILVPVVIPVFFLFAVTLIFVTTSSADIAIARCFYNVADGSWLYADAPICRYLYEYGPLPGILLGLGGLLIGLMSFRVERLRCYRKPAFFVGVMLILGPGLVVNTLVKPNWGRPRPKETAIFGGSQAYVTPWQMGVSNKNKSFPSGHASTGFMLMAPAFLLYRRRRKLAYAFVLLGFAVGGAIGLARMAQGAHYTSDILWAGGLVYLTGLLLHIAFYVDEYREMLQTRRFPSSDGADACPGDHQSSEKQRHVA